ncbi:hypothetical protein [Burkholderia cenocepacia]|uniref:SLOG domain-containing protein n=1 Tax=Burkholderia cenocepacia TaxID=95486 RepID=UPI00264E9571|nr:hypothetical protein [Burkholderia cenocepacia]MDN7631634.1 hypothetical protein [Burkholderia cenocepacia]
MDAIFLSASIPKPGREYYGTADPLLIHAAVRALVILLLGRRHIVWGGHPSITPMVSAACVGLGVPYESVVTLYQSRLFQKSFPIENSRFGNLVLIDAEADMSTSLEALRRRMLGDFKYEAAVFIGGMNGILDEHNMFRAMHPNATVLVVPRPGGAAEDLAKSKYGYDASTDLSPTNFTQLYIDRLGVSPTEPRRS